MKKKNIILDGVGKERKEKKSRQKKRKERNPSKKIRSFDLKGSLKAKVVKPKAKTEIAKTKITP